MEQQSGLLRLFQCAGNLWMDSKRIGNEPKGGFHHDRCGRERRKSIQPGASEQLRRMGDARFELDGKRAGQLALDIGQRFHRYTKHDDLSLGAKHGLLLLCAIEGRQRRYKFFVPDDVHHAGARHSFDTCYSAADLFNGNGHKRHSFRCYDHVDDAEPGELPSRIRHDDELWLDSVRIWRYGLLGPTNRIIGEHHVSCGRYGNQCSGNVVHRAGFCLYDPLGCLERVGAGVSYDSLWRPNFSITGLK